MVVDDGNVLTARSGHDLLPDRRGTQGKAGQMTISDENRARFEGLGTAEVRHELGVGYVRHLSGEQRVQAQDWLAEQDASFKDGIVCFPTLVLASRSRRTWSVV